MQWTNGQQEALTLLSKWEALDIYANPDDSIFTLSGAAGTGKTTVVQEIIKMFKDKYKIIVSAPTHKAKEVIGEITNLRAETIHSLLGLRPNIDLETFDPNNPTYQQLVEERISSADIHIIDECSMINKELFKMLIKKATSYKKRIIFIGDSRQLPPVNEKLSLTFMVKHKYELTEIVRQKNGNPNQLLLIDARSDVEKMSNLVEELTKSEQDNTNNDDRGNRQGYIVTNSQENFYNLLIELYSDSEAKTNMNFIKTLVYTNIAAKKVNKFIKDKINPSKEILSVGDVLLGYKTVMHPVNDKIIVQNSKDYRIYSLEIIEKKVQLKTYKFFRVNVDFINKTYIDILHPESYNEFKDVLSRLFLNAKANRAWRPFYRYREQFIILENFYNDDNTTLTTKDIDFGYAMTIHKSQGSTYNNVAVIYNNIKVCRVDIDKKRLAYVALSRCKYLNLIYG